MLHHGIDDAVFGFVRAMRRHGRRRPGFRQRVLQVRHRLAGRAIKHLADRDRGNQAIVIAAPERLVEEEMAGFFKPASAPSSLVRRFM